jgi:hypothetical protein
MTLLTFIPKARPTGQKRENTWLPFRIEFPARCHTSFGLHLLQAMVIMVSSVAGVSPSHLPPGEHVPVLAWKFPT